MASAMSLVRMAPEAPTRAPAMMSTGLLMTKPDIAAAVPVNEFSRLMTTGMSAPPMGSTMRDAEDDRGAEDDDQDRCWRWRCRATNTSAAPSTRMSVPTAAIAATPSVSGRVQGLMMGWPDMSPWSLRRRR